MIRNRPTIPEVLDRFLAYYRQHPAWHSLHVVLADGNVEDQSVQFCLDWARERGDSEGEELARILLSMSRTQRAKLPGMCSRAGQPNR